ncbi:hypothetical protein ED208_12595 [Stagnimonas aquatica]|uniref:Uncharacterized protein n=1 Tax=Stagnimonas aquatica TaxID=2689987 RepID=A0A3N0V7Q5_9GAMM|nr:hypothetical protein [Stagnimonas aquatica]ROH88651.1 hypothetical protein ED208_12595 [Stagnimonas aquatica]
MSTLDRQSLLAALSRHVGRDRGVTARALVVEICGTWSAAGERHLRELVEALRQDGIAVCADPSNGYHIAATAEELQASIQFLRQRALTSLRQIRQLKRLAQPDLGGQRRLLL